MGIMNFIRGELTQEQRAPTIREIGERFESHGDAKAQLFDYLEVFYNQRRRHSSAGRMSPAAYERKMTYAA